MILLGTPHINGIFSIVPLRIIAYLISYSSCVFLRLLPHLLSLVWESFTCDGFRWKLLYFSFIFLQVWAISYQKSWFESKFIRLFLLKTLYIKVTYLYHSISSLIYKYKVNTNIIFVYTSHKIKLDQNCILVWKSFCNRPNKIGAWSFYCIRSYPYTRADTQK